MYLGSEEHKANLAKAREKAHKTKIACQYCGDKRSTSNIKKHEAGCYLNPAKIKPCVVCGTPLKNREATTCSYACSNKHFRTGPNHGNWNPAAYSSTCFHYHKKECVVCGENKIVEVHHLDENRENNDPSNLIPLCPTHHQYWHSRYREEVEPRIRQYIAEWILDF